MTSRPDDGRDGEVTGFEHATIRAVTRLLDEAVIIQDPSGKIVGWEGSAGRLLGYEASEALGRQGSELVAPVGKATFERLFDQGIADGIRHQVQLDFVRSDGTPVPVALSAGTLRNEAGTVVGVITVARDLTHDRLAVERFGSIVAELEDVRAQALDAEERCKRFLEHAAHQLRTPMACISACVDSMQWGVCPGDSDTMISDLQRETARATRLVQSLLRMARLDQGLVVSPARRDLVQLVSEECERAHGLNPVLDIDVRVSFEVDEDPVIDGDAVREILANLMDNARRHATTRIAVEVVRSAHLVRVSVADDGGGLDAESAEQVFERFVSLDGRGGSGLGLPIARTLARAHGGDLVYEDGAFVFWVATDDDVAGEGDAQPLYEASSS